MDVVVCRFGEIALKGGNRHLFEARLIENMRSLLALYKVDASVKKIRGRVLVYPRDNIDNVVNCIKNVVGLVSISPATTCDLDIEKIKPLALEIVKDKEFKNFRVTTKRSDKRFSMNSNDVDRTVGEVIFETLHKSVKLKNPELNLGIEIFDNAYLFTERVACPGGIPIGMSGNVLCYVESEQDLLAAFLMMKRGCTVILAGPKELDFEFLKKFYHKINFIKTEKSQLKTVAEDHNCKSIVFGDLFETIKDNKDLFDYFVLYPLVSFDENDVISFLEKIKA